jgi:3-oxoacyl-[acyl-carrier protein] reductase
MPAHRFTGKTALVTEAGQPTGRATALALAREGAQVLVHDGAADRARHVAGEIVRDGGRAVEVALDLARHDGPHGLARHARRVVGGRLDILVVQCGAVSCPASMEDTSVADFEALVAATVRAPLFVVQQLLPLLCAGSSVVLVTTQPATAGEPCAQAATHAAIAALATPLAATLGARGARINAVVATLPADTPARARHAGAGPADSAATIAFLASDEARWTSGARVRVGDSGCMPTPQQRETSP